MIWQIKLHSWTLTGKSLPNIFDLHEGDLESAKKKASEVFLNNPGCPKEVVIYDPQLTFMKPAARYDNFKKVMPAWVPTVYTNYRGFK